MRSELASARRAAAMIAGAALVALTCAVALADGAPRRAEKDNPWAEVRTPARGVAEAIGYYSAGCLVGGRALPLVSRSYRVMRPERRRHFGHPAMVEFIRDFAARARRRGLGPLSVGDISQPRGGPAPKGHASHQTGLDADIWYARRGSRRAPATVPMVDPEAKQVTRAWRRRHARLVELAARDPRVDRIFVNPVIKRELCTSAKRNRAWLRKVRSWWGHDEHFHVRLSCPAGDDACKPGEVLPEGDACDDAEWWLSAEAQEELAERRKLYRDRIGVQPRLPQQCTAVVERPERGATSQARRRR